MILILGLGLLLLGVSIFRLLGLKKMEGVKPWHYAVFIVLGIIGLITVVSVATMMAIWPSEQ